MSAHAIARTAWLRSLQLRRALLLAGGGVVVAGAAAALAFYTVGVVNPGGNQAQAVAASLSAPNTPTATVNGSGAITVEWSLPGSQLSGAHYSVTRTGGPGSPLAVCSVVATATSCQDTGLVAGTAYSYSIASGLSNWRSSAITTSATTATPSFTIALSSSPYTAGTAITVTSITATVSGSTDTTYTGAKTLSWSGLANSPSNQAATYPSSGVTFTSGVASPSSTFTAYHAGSNTLTATDSAATGVTGSVTFSAGAAAAHTLAVVSGSSQSATVSTAFASPLVASVTDLYGNPVSGAAVTFTAPSTGASGTFANTTATTTASSGSNGQATSSAFTANTHAGAYNVSATAGGTNSVNFALTNTAGAASAIAVVSGSGQSTAVTTAFGNAFVASVVDGFNNPVPGVTVTFTAPSSGASGTFANSTTTTTATTGSNGQATSSTFTANTHAGTYTVSASAPGTNTVTYSLTNTAASAATLAVVSGSGQSAAQSAAFANPLVASVADSYGNPVSGVTVTFAAPSSGASGTFANGTASTTALTGSNGQATSSTFTANSTGGSYNVVASAAGLSSVNFAMTNTGPTVSKYAVGMASPQTAGTAFTVTLTAEDSSGNTVTSYNASNQAITWSGPANSPSGHAPTLPSSTVSFSSGVATTTLQATLYHASSQTLTATDAQSRTGSGTVFVNSAGSGLSFTTACPGTLSNGSTWTSTLTIANDSYGNPATYMNPGFSFTVSLGGSDPSKFTLTGASLQSTGSPTGSFSVKATASNKSATVTATGSGFTSATCTLSS